MDPRQRRPCQKRPPPWPTHPLPPNLPQHQPTSLSHPRRRRQRPPRARRRRQLVRRTRITTRNMNSAPPHLARQLCVAVQPAAATCRRTRARPARELTRIARLRLGLPSAASTSTTQTRTTVATPVMSPRASRPLLHRSHPPQRRSRPRLPRSQRRPRVRKSPRRPTRTITSITSMSTRRGATGTTSMSMGATVTSTRRYRRRRPRVQASLGHRPSKRSRARAATSRWCAWPRARHHGRHRLGTPVMQPELVPAQLARRVERPGVGAECTAAASRASPSVSDLRCIL